METLASPSDLGLWLVRAELVAERPRVTRALLDAARMLGIEEQARRVRICASQTCSARFFDRSPAGQRRWCSMALCGNEAKARRHRERVRGERSTQRAAA